MTTVWQWVRMMLWLFLFLPIVMVTAWIFDAAALPSEWTASVALGLWVGTVVTVIAIRYVRGRRRYVVRKPSQDAWAPLTVIQRPCNGPRQTG